MTMQNEIYEYINYDVKAIKRYDKDIQKTYVFIARRIYELKQSNNLEKVDYKGYKNIYDLCLNEFGYESTKVKYLISIFLNFFNVPLSDKVRNRYEEFSISQLRFMCDMEEEQLKQCKPEMTVREIKKIKLDTRVSSDNVENMELLNNKLPGQNIITGVFPDNQVFEEPEQKQNTIIVTELPKPERVENKTITIEVKSEQNNDFVTNNEDTELIVLKKAYDDLYSQYFDVKNQLLNSQKQVRELLKNIDARNDVLQYVHAELYNINNPIQNDDIDNLCSALYDFINHKKLPEKLNFYKNVV